MSQIWRRAPTLMLMLMLILALPGCAFDNFAPPPVSLALIAHARYDHADAPTLSHGRELFVSRCLECHTLPSVTKHSSGEWPHLVSRMAVRANLSASDQEAITVYLRAASSAGAAPR